jgi:hypothetical protein
MAKGSFNEICACGHSMSKHELVGTEYSRCIDFTTVKRCPCKCAGGEARAVVWTDKPLFFKWTSRGFDYPHALEGACEKARSSGAEVLLMISDCEICGAELDKVSGRVYSVALDNDERMYSGRTQQARGGRESLQSDYGLNRVICGGCDAVRGD